MQHSLSQETGRWQLSSSISSSSEDTSMAKTRKHWSFGFKVMPLIKCQKGNIILAKRAIGQTGSRLFILFCCSQWSVVVRIFFYILNSSMQWSQHFRARKTQSKDQAIHGNTIHKYNKIGTYVQLTIFIYFSHRFGHLGLSAWLLLRHLLQIVSQTFPSCLANNISWWQ